MSVEVGSQKLEAQKSAVRRFHLDRGLLALVMAYRHEKY